MPLPRKLAELNRKRLNRLTTRFAGQIPPFALIEHVGRSSGNPYVTPIMVFRSGETWRFALTYGPGTDWVRNVIDANEATLVYRNRRVCIVDPSIERGADATATFPLPVRIALSAMNARDVLRLRTDPA